MEDKDILKKLFEAIEKSEIPEKDELRSEANSLIGCFITYFIHVAREQLFYSATPADKQNTAMMKIKNKMRGEAHDSCIMACKRLNEISEKVNTVPFAGFDTDDRRKVAEFAGYIVSSMYFSNINCKASLASCLISGDLTEKDVDIFLKVFRDELQERLNCLFEDIRVICHDAKINGRILSLDFEDSIGRHGTKETEIDPTRLYEPGYINSCIDTFFSNIGSALYAQKSSFVTVKISNNRAYWE